MLNEIPYAVTLELAKTVKARENLEYFSTYCWENQPGFYPNAEFHKEWYSILQPETRPNRFHTQAPRTHAKTTCLSVKYPLWRLGHNHNLRFLYVSKTGTLAKDILSEVRQNIDSNRRLQKVFPDLKPSLPWSTTELTVQRTRLDKTPTMRAVGLHGSITGGRADIIILDDPFDAAEVQTERHRAKVEHWIEKVVIPVLTPTGEIVAVGTRWHQADYWSKLLQKPMYVCKIYRCYPDLENPEKTLWPEVWSRERLEARKAEIGTLRFNCLYMNDPTGLEGLIFKEKWLVYYNPEMLRFITDLELYMGVDPAISEDPKADYTAIVVLAWSPHRNLFYILDVYREHLDFPDQVRKIKEKYLQWQQIAASCKWAGPLKIGVESVAYQKALARTTFLQGLPTKEIKTKTNKQMRMLGLSPHFEGGRFLLPDPEVERVPWLQPFIDEYVSFPRGVHDDMLDGVDLAVEVADITKPEGGFFFG